MTEAKLRVFRGMFDMLMELLLSGAAVVFLFWTTSSVLGSQNVGVGAWVLESGSFGGTVFLVYKFYFKKKKCRKCGTTF